jgi:hypothetical protein
VSAQAVGGHRATSAAAEDDDLLGHAGHTSSSA